MFWALGVFLSLLQHKAFSQTFFCSQNPVTTKSWHFLRGFWVCHAMPWISKGWKPLFQWDWKHRQSGHKWKFAVTRTATWLRSFRARRDRCLFFLITNLFLCASKDWFGCKEEHQQFCSVVFHPSWSWGRKLQILLTYIKFRIETSAHSVTRIPVCCTTQLRRSWYCIFLRGREMCFSLTLAFFCLLGRKEYSCVFFLRGLSSSDYELRLVWIAGAK